MEKRPDPVSLSSSVACVSPCARISRLVTGVGVGWGWSRAVVSPEYWGGVSGYCDGVFGDSSSAFSESAAVSVSIGAGGTNSDPGL